MHFYQHSCLTVLLIILPFTSCLFLNTITPNQPLKDGDVLISTRKKFALGFFSPGNSHNRYVGIWYHQIPEQTVVWVANRDNPLNDTSGALAIDNHGGLLLFGKNRSFPFWSTNVSIPAANISMVKLLDVGNLVLLGNNTEESLLWQSFDHPTDTILPSMKFGWKRVTGLDNIATSWKSMDDPGTGNYSYWFKRNGNPQLFLSEGRAPRWRTGSWIGIGWSGIPQMSVRFIFNVTFMSNQDEVWVMYCLYNESTLTRLVVDESGTVYRSTWLEERKRWVRFYSAPPEKCDAYEFCGPNGVCNPVNNDGFECTCLPGFDPRSPKDWYLRDGSGGCVRKQELNRTCGNKEGFVKLARVKVPDTSKAHVNMNISLKSCGEECLRNCTCTAYSSATVSEGCITWHDDLVDARTYSNWGQDLYVRVDSITLAQYLKNSKNSSINKIGKVGIALSSFAILILFLFFIYWWRKTKTKAKEQRSENVYTTSIYFNDNSGENEYEECTNNSELTLFDLNTIAAATNNFSIDNKLGEGGFGSVYRGVFSDGKEIAVKRLSKNSGQGNKEFKNEVLLISKLQHKNLVRVLGCCIQGVEKMLIYEYLPNKSLDVFIFDKEKRGLLDWRKRFDIICGIARAMLYLHHDSRLRIIHRDLKTANVLLDANLNPKISDFGMARIFGEDEIEVNTHRVVGTYGYMSPEYAMKGRYSIKSDVYSFGVMVLEIITGKKNSGYCHENLHSNLMAHVWDLWKEGRALEIIDSSIDERFGSAALRCITIGLLCVQEHAINRPNMSEIVLMLSNEATLPNPKQPAFVSGDPLTSERLNSENKFRGGKIRDAWRMCIDDEWSQGAERYRFEDVVSFYVFFYGFTCIFRIIM
ncbi:G-type lectin S-receptor-like serine/threonine-protein kinase RKS1 isoform X2 [Humulus lupulus]|uniref:G-type lectin S-receptor-like serine/threonine-protein kinase RKS1 isoform X2 n=1 Tax=Humulus lupulus TaxID=3486 RepID=UPI002B40F706|nr:G-type lectin S-receptor-like serine/threonine-protein kinase RKS1 isoform X2 [Humulus lupulus]